MKFKNTIIAGVAGASLVAAGFGIAGATTNNSTIKPGPGTIQGCVNLNTHRTMFQVYTDYLNFPGCTGNEFPVVWNVKGQQGPPGVNGTNGTNGTNGILNATSVPLPATTVSAGGHFLDSFTPVTTIQLDAGTYLMSVNFKGVAVTDDGPGGQITPQVFVYNGVPDSDFSNDLFNAGGGDLQPATTGHDSYYSSGEQLVTVPSGGDVLNIEGFGYLDDQGSGTWNLEAGSSVTIVQVNSSS